MYVHAWVTGIEQDNIHAPNKKIIVAWLLPKYINIIHAINANLATILVIYNKNTQ